MSKYMKEFSAEQVRDLANLREYTAKSLAVDTGLTEQGVNKLFRGDSKPFMENADKIAQKLCVSRSDLMNSEEKQKEINATLAAKNRIVDLLNHSQMETLRNSVVSIERVLKSMGRDADIKEHTSKASADMEELYVKLNPLGKALLRDYLDEMEMIEYLTADCDDLTVEIHVGCILEEEEGEEGTIFVKFSRWFCRIFNLEAVYDIPFALSDMDNWEEEAEVEVQNFIDEQLAPEFDESWYEMFTNLIENAEWSEFVEMEFAEGEADPFSEVNIRDTRACFDKLYSKMAWDGKGADISRTLTDWDFAREMFGKYGIELPAGM